MSDAVKKFQENLGKVEKALKDDIRKGIFMAALLLQREAQLRSPVDTGALRASAYTRRAQSEEKQGEIIYEVGFSQNYAVYVHENVGANFKVGQAKYLEEPAKAIGARLGEFISGSVKSGRKTMGIEPPRDGGTP